MRLPLLRSMMPLLLALVVVLAQTLVPLHRATHPSAGLVAGNAAARATTATVSPGSALDLLLGHTSGAACDTFDAAFGNDFNPATFAPALTAFAATHTAPAAPAAFLASSHPAGLFLARAPPLA